MNSKSYLNKSKDQRNLSAKKCVDHKNVFNDHKEGTTTIFTKEKKE